ncbi:MAG: 4Fe-4S dicluster domain-containing protein [Gemmatimonadota bacterium]|nr:4Fe-4S dicluster domain-containing protein [Gemmatimonadota bacterium]
MQHQIPVDTLGPSGEAMAGAVESCVHCGFCLPACPTYNLLEEEMDSPRGRIILMKGVLEGELPLEEVLPHIDRCLGCLGCVSACPSGVQYGNLITPFRALAESRRHRPLAEKVTRTLINQTLPYPDRFRMAAQAGRLGKSLARLLPDPLLPEPFRAMLGLLPETLPPAAVTSPLHPAAGPRRARVALLTGCAQQVLAPEINTAAIQVLVANGVEVVVPPDQGCCGALSMHTGAAEEARELALRNFNRLDPGDVDAVVTTAAGCGSGMHEYPLLFAGTEHEDRAHTLAAKVRDVSELLDELGALIPPPLPRPLTVAYHDACHLAHGQGVREAPRRLLNSIPGVTLAAIPEGDLCCGSAGTYNIEQPRIADQLGERKARMILETGAELIATGNIGCATQIGHHLRQLGRPLPVRHTVELLAAAYNGTDPGTR